MYHYRIGRNGGLCNLVRQYLDPIIQDSGWAETAMWSRVLRAYADSAPQSDFAREDVSSFLMRVCLGDGLSRYFRVRLDLLDMYDSGLRRCRVGLFCAPVLGRAFSALRFCRAGLFCAPVLPGGPVLLSDCVGQCTFALCTCFLVAELVQCFAV